MKKVVSVWAPKVTEGDLPAVVVVPAPPLESPG